MELRKGELRVYYRAEAGKKAEIYYIDFELDVALRNLLEEFGYGFLAGGVDTTTGIRDQAYERDSFDEFKQWKEEIPSGGQAPPIIWSIPAKPNTVVGTRPIKPIW